MAKKKNLKMRPICVRFNDGDYLSTNINGTNQEILKHYVGNDFEKSDETTHYAISVEFLDEQKLDPKLLTQNLRRQIEDALELEDEEDDEKLEEKLKYMGKDEIFDKILTYEGIINYSNWIMTILSDLETATLHS